MDTRYGLLIDLKRCIGCHTCTMACKMENGIADGSWIRVETVGGPHMDTPSGKYPDLRMHYLPRVCNHCAQPRCIPACPTQAIVKRKDGIVLVQGEKCVGCGDCTKACPYQAPQVNPTMAVAQMCTLCFHRVQNDREPFCVRCCPTRALEFGNISDPDSPISKQILKKSASVLNPEAGTKPSVFYAPP